MVNLDLEVIIPIFMFFVLLGLFILFLYQTFTKNRKAYLMSLSIVFGLFGIFFMATGNLLPSDSFIRVTGSILAEGFFFYWLYFFLYLHYEQISRQYPKLQRILIMSALLGIGISTTIILLLIDEVPPLINQMNDWGNFLIRLLSFSFATYVTFKGWQFTKERVSLVEMISLSILAIGGFPEIIDHYFTVDILGEMSLEVVGNLITFVGLVLLILAYTSNPNYLYRLPFPIYYLMLFNAGGIAVYSKSVRNRKIPTPEFSDQLVSGTIAAISMFMREGIGAGTGDTNLRYIDANDRSIICEQNPENEVTAMLMSRYSTPFTRRSLKDLLNKIPTEMYKSMDDPMFTEDTEVITQLDSIVKNVFPYLKFNE